MITQEQSEKKKEYRLKNKEHINFLFVLKAY